MLLYLAAAAVAGCVSLVFVIYERHAHPKMLVATSKTPLPTVSTALKSFLSLTSYEATHYWLDWHGFFATVIPAVVRRFHLNREQEQCYEQEIITLPDGGTIALDWLHDADMPADAPILLIQHGLGSNSLSTYVVHMMRASYAHGYRVATMIARGCADLKLTTPEPFNGVRTSDFAHALELVRNRYPDADLYGVGFSLGGALLAKYLGEQGEDCVLKGAVVVSPPWNFNIAPYAFDFWSKWYLAGCLHRYLKRHYHVAAQHKNVDVDKVARSTSVGEFDASWIVPCFGFKDVNDYYDQASPVRLSHRIHTPTLALNAVDDPVCSSDGCPQGDEIGPGLVLIKTRTGGHVAFGEGLIPGTESFMERASLQWLLSVRAAR